MNPNETSATALDGFTEHLLLKRSEVTSGAYLINGDELIPVQLAEPTGDDHATHWRPVLSLEDFSTIDWDGCPFRRIRSLVPTTSGQSFRVIRSP